MIELKPCPFCGAPAQIYVRDGVRVVCMKCEAQTREMVDNIINNEICAVQDVIDAWNRRKEDGTECTN